MKVRTLVVLFFNHFVNDFYSLLFPMFIPTLMLSLKINYFEASILLSCVAIIGALFQSPIGYWADLYRKRVVFMALGFMCYAIGAIILGLSNGFYLLLASSFLVGLAHTTYHPQGTNIITKIFEKKGSALGIHGVGGQFGRFFSPILIAFLISTLEWRKAAMVVALPALVAFFLSFVFLKEPAEKGEKGLTRAFTLPVLLLVLTLGLRSAIFQGTISFLPSFLVEKGSSLNLAGVLTGVMLGTGILAQLIGGVIGDRVPKGRIIFLSLLGLTLFFLLFYFKVINQNASIEYGFLIFSLIGIGFCIFVTFPVGLALSAEITPGERVGASVGAVMGGGLILPSVTLPVVGFLIDKFGFKGGFGLLGLLATVATLISIFYLKIDSPSSPSSKKS
ncbi:MFS transporter [Candidatus Aerophobetes bacterium]|nr:MFS transporter [Candidatus Aerophobetes bacterium]